MPTNSNNPPSTLQQLAQELGKVYDPAKYQGVLQRMFPGGPIAEIQNQLPALPTNFTEQELPAQLQALRQWVEDARSIGPGSLIDDVAVFARRFKRLFAGRLPAGSLVRVLSARQPAGLDPV